MFISSEATEKRVNKLEQMNNAVFKLQIMRRMKYVSIHAKDEVEYYLPPGTHKLQ